MRASQPGGQGEGLTQSSVAAGPGDEYPASADAGFEVGKSKLRERCGETDGATSKGLGNRGSGSPDFG